MQMVVTIPFVRDKNQYWFQFLGYNPQLNDKSSYTLNVGIKRVLNTRRIAPCE